jgi:thioesterase DpgC
VSAAAIQDDAASLARAGLPENEVQAWLDGAPQAISSFAADTARFASFWAKGNEFFDILPAKPVRDAAQAVAVATIDRVCRKARESFLTAHVEPLYRALTRDYGAFVRVEDLVYDAARLVPGLSPNRERVAAEGTVLQRDKDGSEIDQGLLLAHVLAHAKSGAHLCHAMLLPRADALERLPHFVATGTLDLGTASIERRGRAAHVTMRNAAFLNAEDETTIDALEIAIDLATLDPKSDIAVLRGDVVQHAKYRGRRVFNAGINLTHLYRGKISFVWYLKRDMGLVNKLFRGVARHDGCADEVLGDSIEKPWLAAVDSFAIGGGCQLLLAVDYVLAASDAYLTLPARKEGIIPGAANLRLWRFTGDRIARQAILYGRRLDCDSAEGRLICDEVVPPSEMDDAIARVVENFTSSGVVSAAGNRRAMRVGAEPLDLFRRYMAVYAKEQAPCHFSPALIANLERNWDAQNRRG